MRTALIVACMVLSPSLGAAQGDVEEKARAAFKEGVLAFEEGRTSDALVSFQRAYSLRPAFKLLYNIGQAQTELGLTRQAIESFEGYLVEGGEHIDADRRLQVEAELSRLRVLAGVHPAQSGPPPPKDESGDRVEEAERAGENRFMTKAAPWMFGGLALATTGAGIAMGARALSLNNSLGSDCTDGVCPPSYEEDISSLKGSAAAADALLITGAVLTATAVIIAVVVRNKKKGESE